MPVQIMSETETGRSTPTTSPENSSTSSSLSTTTTSSSSSASSEHETEAEIEEEQPPQPLHVLSLMQGSTIQFNKLNQIEKLWERSPTRLELTHAIESFRDAIMIPVNNEIIVIFYMRNGSISQAQRLTVESAIIEDITLPDDIGCANLALFCLLKDTIYCFARTNQQVFHR